GVSAVFRADAQPLLHLFVEVLQQDLARSHHRLVDLAGQIELELLETRLDLARVSAIPIDLGDAPLEVHAGADGTQYFVARPENALKELEFLLQQGVYAGIRLVAAIHKVHNDHVELLSVAMTAANALLNALRVPRQVI